MAESRPRTGSRVRPTDRPARGRRGSSARTADERRRSRGRSALNPGFGRGTVLTILAVVVVLVGGFLVFFTSLFGVRDITVEGASVLSADEVRAAVGLSADDSLAGVDTDEVAARLEELPPVAKASVSRSWPATLVVEVTERTPVATVLIDGDPWLIDIEGVPYVAVQKDTPGADGLLPLEVADPGPQSQPTREALEVIDALDADTRALVKKVTAQSAAQVTLVLKDGRQVIWGDASRMNDKLTMLPAVLTHPGMVFDISSPTAIVVK